MSETAGGDIRISGAGTITGGKYQSIHVSGAGKVQGDVEAVEIRASGAATFDGSVRAETVRISGAGKMQGDVSAGSLHCSGSCKLGGNFTGKELHASGAVDIEGDLTCDDVQISGGAKIGGGIKGKVVSISGGCKIAKDVEADEFKSKGAIEIGGLLNAERIEIELVHRNRIKEIGGTSIEVKSGSRLNGLISLLVGRGKAGELVVNSVEGDDVRLEGTKAEIVRGRRVTIGKDCVIGSVEYTETLDIEDDAKVGNQVKAES